MGGILFLFNLCRMAGAMLDQMHLCCEEILLWLLSVTRFSQFFEIVCNLLAKFSVRLHIQIK